MKLHVSTLVAQSQRFFFISFPCTNSSGSLFSEELKTIIFGFKNSLFLSEFYHDTSLFNLEQF